MTRKRKGHISLQQSKDIPAAGELAGGDELRKRARERRAVDAEEVGKLLPVERRRKQQNRQLP